MGDFLEVEGSWPLGVEPVEEATIEVDMSEANELEGFVRICNTMAEYTVYHLYQDVDGEHYRVRDVIRNEGEIGSNVSPPTIDRVGFESPSLQEITITEDGNAEVKYYYTRKRYNLNLQQGTGIKKVTGTGSYLYEQEVTISADRADSTKKI